jgi:hypothetical protein
VCASALSHSFTRLEWSALITTPLNHTSRCRATRAEIVFTQIHAILSSILICLQRASDSFACHTISLSLFLHLFCVSVYRIFLLVIRSGSRLAQFVSILLLICHRLGEYNLCALSLLFTPHFLSSHTHTHTHTYISAIKATRITIMSERVYFSSTVRHPELQHFGGQEGQEHQGKPILMSGISISHTLSLSHTYTPTNHLFRTFPFSLCGKAFCALACDFPWRGAAGPNCRTAFAEALNLRFRSTLFLLD